ncbi:MerR family transcriptional regulator [Corynebacterium breve]|uniref:MerR family transcriptional regulator n=1 Tax=Corynebacterium breve TaxID=3049799 RepID=A0ABY8VEL5_9CORY|nr:MerR family transcriptional regulator [Corynebacterium breve]WIM67782.1 MerR family transcriptional regulator [Corynebacterium breve]
MQKERAPLSELGLKIGEVTQLTGLSDSTLRHYDSVGLISPSKRSAGGFRLYDDRDVQRILLIRRMKPLGFSLDQMRDFLDAADVVRGESSASERAQAEATIAGIREEAHARYAKLQKQIGYAEDFLGTIDALEG